jgi:WD40 repeat protein
MNRKAVPADKKLNVFISYSRKDLAFAQRIVKALEARGLQVTIDTRDLPKLEDWSRELLGLIRQADATLFIVSNSSISSPACAWEIEQTVQLNKRLAPVVLERVPDDRIPDAVAKINCIYLDQIVDFDAEMDALASALQTDQAWVKEHTRLGERARRWQEQNRTTGSVLRGRELLEAEEWNARRPHGAAGPTDPTQEFIFQSRRAANRRRNALTASLAAGLIFAIAVASYAIRQQAIAAVQRAIAVDQRNQAWQSQSRFLADLANHATDQGDSGKGLLLSLEALPDSDFGVQRPYVPAAESGLFHAYCLNYERLILPHNSVVASARFSPDGRRVLTASYDGLARLWDAKSGALLLQFRGHKAQVLSAQFSPDGSRVVTASYDGTARVWDASTAAELVVLKRPNGKISDASFNNDGTRVVTSDDTSARIWNAASGQELVALPHQSRVRNAKFSPDGRSIVTVAADGLHFWQAQTGTQEAYIQGLAFAWAEYSPDGQYVITSESLINRIRVWDAVGKREVGALTGLAGAVNEAHFDAGGLRILAAFADGTARMWDVKTRMLIASLIGHTWEVTSVDISRDGSRFVTASKDNTARVWDMGRPCDPTTLDGHKASVESASFNPDGSRLVTASKDGTALVWNTRTGQQIVRLRSGGDTAIATALFNSDGARILTAGGTAVRMWDAATGGLIWSLDDPPAKVQGASFSRDDRLVAVALSDGTVKILDGKSGTQRFILRGHTASVSSVSFNPNGTHVLTASRDGTVRVWDTKTGLQATAIYGIRSGAQDAQYGADGERIITAPNFDSVAEVWDAASGRELAVLEANTPIHHVSLSPDGTMALTNTNFITVWDAASGLKKFDLPSSIFLGAVHWSAFFPDNRRIVTASYGNIDGPSSDRSTAIQIWDAGTGAEVARFKGPRSQVNSGAVSPDGKMIALVSADGTAMILHIFASTQSLVRGVKNLVPRCLTPDERIAAFLSSEPPDWCITLHKWPYQTTAWSTWLAARRSGLARTMPEADPPKIVTDCIMTGNGSQSCRPRQAPTP